MILEIINQLMVLPTSALLVMLLDQYMLHLLVLLVSFVCFVIHVLTIRHT